jgi:hypothetical protein
MKTYVPEVESASAVEVNVPAVRMTVPVGTIAVPVDVTRVLGPATATVTGRISLTGTLVGTGVTVTVVAALPGDTAGHAFTTLATFSDPSPVASSYPVPALKPGRTPTTSPE